MMNNGYEISLYHSGLMSQVVNLGPYIWGDDTDRNMSYFKWKYDDNPFTEQPPGVVALCKGKVVGFRGYFATRWHIREKDYKMVILCPGDTVVHPEHQRRGLSVAMGNLAMDEYVSKYKVFLNMSATKNSVPGYLRLGFIPLLNKAYYTRCDMLGLFRLIMAAKKRHERKELCKTKITFGEFNNIVVTDSPRPEEMYAIICRLEYDGSRIQLFQDVDFFRWRFNNKRKKYVFYYYRQNNITRGYVVMGMSANNQCGYILDWAANDNTQIKEIFQYIIRMRHFDAIFVLNFGLNNNFLQVLKGLKFKDKCLIRSIQKRLGGGEWPLLVRPVKRNYVNDGFFIEGLDIRKKENWGIKQICSDGV